MTPFARRAGDRHCNDKDPPDGDRQGVDVRRGLSCQMMWIAYAVTAFIATLIVLVSCLREDG
jgi:hypothetical protein